MMKTKYKLMYILVFVISAFLFRESVQADYKAIVDNPSGAKCDIYQKSHPNSRNNGYCFYENSNFNSIVNKVFFLDSADQVTVLTSKGTVPTNNVNLCKDYYVYATYYFPNNPSVVYTGLYCNAYLKTVEVTDSLKKEFQDAGFPDSYWDGLSNLKTIHPNWTFKAVKTNLDWNSAVTAESAVGVSLIDAEEQGYRSTLGGSYDYYSDKFTVKEGSRWYAANSEVVAYYMDPRNFLQDKDIFQFATLESNPLLDNIDGVNAVLKNHFLLPNAQDFVTASSSSKVNSVYLAALAVQEIGNGTVATSGNGFVYSQSNNKYSSLKGKWINGGFYNVYNIGAGTDAVPAQNSVVYARGGENGTETSYGRPWTSLSKAIIGGAQFIGENYLQKGQYTIYSKKFNVHPIEWNLYSHQYQTNIRGASSEGTKIYNAYYELGILDKPFTFTIPVYENMPEKTSMPNPGNPNNYLKELKVDGQNVSGFDGAKTDYTFYVGYGKSSVTISATTVNSNATVSNLGVKNLNVGDNKLSFVVTAQNGKTKTYNLNIVRSANESGEPTIDEIVEKIGVKSDGTYFSGIQLNTQVETLFNKIKSVNANAQVTIKGKDGSIKSNTSFSTGDTVSITSAGETKIFIIVIYGDTDGNGKIDPLDLLRIQKDILSVSKLNGAFYKAADTSRNGKIDPLDLLQVQKHILGVGYVEQ